MLRKIIVNMLLAFVFMPLFSLLLSLYVSKNGYFVEGGKITIQEIFKRTIQDFSNSFVIGIFLLFIVLLPYQIIIDYFYAKEKKLSITKKFLVFCGLMIFFIGVGMSTLYGFFLTPVWHNLTWLLVVVISSIVFVLLHYLAIDRYVEK